ncbi:MAG TPA: hypothetical protein VKT52_07770 [Ktedonobacterales bacterium]|nr:hypothetical protein [Ktedonobacterales bacterium]
MIIVTIVAESATYSPFSSQEGGFTSVGALPAAPGGAGDEDFIPAESATGPLPLYRWRRAGPSANRILAKTAMPLSSSVNLRSLRFLRVEPRLPAASATER